MKVIMMCKGNSLSKKFNEVKDHFPSETEVFIAENAMKLPYVYVNEVKTGNEAGQIVEIADSDGNAVTVDELFSLKEKGYCRYAVTVPHIILTEAIEIIDVTEFANAQMEGAKRWKMKK